MSLIGPAEIMHVENGAAGVRLTLRTLRNIKLAENAIRVVNDGAEANDSPAGQPSDLNKGRPKS